MLIPAAFAELAPAVSTARAAKVISSSLLFFLILGGRLLNELAGCEIRAFDCVMDIFVI